MTVKYSATGAVISPDGVYRYRLMREWGAFANEHWPRQVLWVMLNPSTADGGEDDPTIRRCVGFSREWGYTGLMVGNVFAYRATDPSQLNCVSEDVAAGPDNHKHIYAMAKASCAVIFGWGGHKISPIRVRTIFDAVRAAGHYPKSFGVTASGMPRHPLYLPANTHLDPWQFSGMRPR